MSWFQYDTQYVTSQDPIEDFLEFRAESGRFARRKQPLRRPQQAECRSRAGILIDRFQAGLKRHVLSSVETGPPFNPAC